MADSFKQRKIQIFSIIVKQMLPLRVVKRDPIRHITFDTYITRSLIVPIDFGISLRQDRFNHSFRYRFKRAIHHSEIDKFHTLPLVGKNIIITSHNPFEREILMHNYFIHYEIT